MMTPKKMTGRVEYKENLVGQNYLVRFGFEEEVSFVPGQYISLKVSDEGLRRSYSVASLPGGKTVDVLVDVSPMGVGSKYILGLKVGEVVEVLSFFGKFTIDFEQLARAKQVLFLATGTGIAPIKPMIEDLLCQKNYLGEVRLIWGMRHEEDLYWLKEIDNLKRDFDNFKFEVVLSKPREDWPGFRGHVGEVVDCLSQSWSQTLVYLCGAPEMITEMEKKVSQKGVPDEQIFYEKYY
jgi:NAD(P)H-flavin reductase